jgi:hypothetical protein
VCYYILPPLTRDSLTDTFLSNNPGGLAQLGERLHGMQEVSGSSPLSSIGLAPTSSPEVRGLFMRPRRVTPRNRAGKWAGAAREWYSAKHAVAMAKNGWLIDRPGST